MGQIDFADALSGASSEVDTVELSVEVVVVAIGVEDAYIVDTALSPASVASQIDDTVGIRCTVVRVSQELQGLPSPPASPSPPSPTFTVSNLASVTDAAVADQTTTNDFAAVVVASTFALLGIDPPDCSAAAAAGRRRLTHKGGCTHGPEGKTCRQKLNAAKAKDTSVMTTTTTDPAGTASAVNAATCSASAGATCTTSIGSRGRQLSEGTQPVQYTIIREYDFDVRRRCTRTPLPHWPCPCPRPCHACGQHTAQPGWEWGVWPIPISIWLWGAVLTAAGRVLRTTGLR